MHQTRKIGVVAEHAETSIGITAGVIGALTTAVGVLWKVGNANLMKQQEQMCEAFQKTHAELSSKLDKCEEKHEQAHDQLVELATRVGRLEGQLEERDRDS